MDPPNSTADRRNLWLVDAAFMSHVEFTDTGCWEWQSATDRRGYARVFRDGRTWLAHRWAYFQTFGDIDAELDLDHLCRNIRCVNPDHLEPVTNLVNNQRNPTWTGNREFCRAGHPYSEENTYPRPDGARGCRTCRREANRRRRRSTTT